LSDLRNSEGRTFRCLSIARSSSGEATSPNSICTFNNNQTIIALNPPIIMFEVSKQKVLTSGYRDHVRLTQQFSACPHMLVLILVLLQYRVQYRFVKPRHKKETTYASQSQSLAALAASLLHTSFPHYLSSFSVLGQHLPTQSRQPRGSHTRTFLSHFYFSFVRLPFLYSIPFTGAPEDASTIQNIDIADR
jgi:hypothetical protein